MFISILWLNYTNRLLNMLYTQEIKSMFEMFKDQTSKLGGSADYGVNKQ